MTTATSAISAAHAAEQALKQSRWTEERKK